jgi:abhydrolase domain-containing protein 6
MCAARVPLLAVFALLALCSPAGAEGLQAQSLTVDGVRVRYFDTGVAGDAAAGRTILFVHGYCGSASNFTQLCASLAAAEGLPCGPSRYVAVDLPGCAGSDKPDVPYSTAWFVNFLESFRLALGLEDLVLVGHSMGGQICLHYTRRFPHAVEKLILIAPDGLAGEEGGWLALTTFGPLVDTGLTLANRSFVEILLRTVIYRDQALVTPALVDCYCEGLLTPEGARATAAITREVIGHDPVDAILPSILQKTLVIWGAEDRLLRPSWAPRFVQLLPAAELALVDGCGHAPMIEKPAETAALIAEFLSR